MHTLFRDIRYAIVALIKNPAFSTTAVLVLALGVGASTLMFSVVNSVLLRPLPYPQADRIVVVWEDATAIGFPKNTPAPANFVDWRSGNKVFSHMAALADTTAVITAGEPEEVMAHRVTSDFFPVLEVRPRLGRPILPEDDSPEASRVVVISHSLWQRRFGGDPSVIGKTIELSANTHTVIGVMPPWFTYPAPDNDLWVPMRLAPAEAARRYAHYLTVIARLRPGVSLEAARKDMSEIAQRLEGQYPESNSRIGSVVLPLYEELVGDVRPALMILSGAVAILLLGTCANVANLLLVRLHARKREIAIRLSLGAGRWRIVRQMLTESVVLAVTGTAAGVVMALGGIRLLNRIIPPILLHGAAINPDGTVLSFAIVVSILTGLLFGALPAFQSLQLHQGTRGVNGKLKRAFRNALVVAELACALVLVVGAGLLIQSFRRIIHVDIGFQASGVLTMRVAPPATKYPTPQLRADFYDRIVDKIEASPEVDSAAVVSNLPLDFRGNSNSFTIEGDAPYPPNQTPILVLRVVGQHYFDTMKIPLQVGRSFDRTDRSDAPGVAIVNEAAARKHWPGQDALGKRLKLGGYASTQPWLTVVGVAKDVHEFAIGEVRPQIYLPYAQFGVFAPQYLTVRVKAGEPARFAAQARQMIWDVDANQPVMRVRSMEEIVSTSVSDRRFNMLLVGTFAGLAVGLASIGLYGVLSFVVSQRTSEIGLRLALGAVPRDVIRLVLVQGIRLIAAGIAAGLVVALAATRLLSGLLFGVGFLDPVTFVMTTALLLGVGLAATVIPAIRASRVDPAISLRVE